MNKLIRSWDEVPVVMDCAMAALITGRTTDDIRKRCARNKIRAVKDGKSWIITKTAMMEYCGEEGSVWEKEIK